jgi:DNA-binding GntR family transcriptional regulator
MSVGNGPRGMLTSSGKNPSAYELTKQAILAGKLMPGQQLVETALAEWLNVSRTPIREALTRLEQDGLVERSARGLVVRERSPEEILDIYESRCVLETAVAESAAERRTDHDLRLIQSMVARSDSVKPDGRSSTTALMVDSNRRFHEVVWRASHNESLIDLLQRLDLHLARYPATTLAYEGRWGRSNTQHQALFDAIAARDVAAARAAATLHFSEAREIRLELWRQNLA